MANVTESTSIDRPKIECAGVAAGANMLVGDCADPVPAKTALYAARPPFSLPYSVAEYLSKQDNLSDLEIHSFLKRLPESLTSGKNAKPQQRQTPFFF